MADVSRAITEVSSVIRRDGGIPSGNRWLQVLEDSDNLPEVQVFLASSVDGKRTT